MSPDLERQLRQVLAELELVSHVNAVSLDGNGGRDTSDDIGGNRPPGGIDRADDRETDWTMKSADHYRRRAHRAHTDRALEQILTEARRSLEAWKRQPLPTSEPEFGSPQWKRWAAQSPLSDSDIARRFHCSRQYVHRIRAQYRDAA